VAGQRISRGPLVSGELIELGGTLFTLHDALATPHGTSMDAEGLALGGRAYGFGTLVPSYARALHALAQVAMGDLSILLLGESGTGKELLASGIHAMSGRRGSFVPVNCGAIPESLVEGQLFGHLKGAFSGAERDQPGFVRASDRGTLLLDEIGDLPRTSQAALLRVLQEREVVPIGSTKAFKVDLRVVSATHRPVDTPDGGLRSDLYARVAGYTHRLLPLRERRADLGTLVADLLARAPRHEQISLSPALGRALYAYDWPLNVRELGHVLAAAVMLAEGGVLDLRHAPEPLRGVRLERGRPSERAGVTEDHALKASLAAVLAEKRGNVSEVARAMGKTRMQIHRWMRRFGLDPEVHRAR
jgi:transcriptional regulator with PAS, ATPase and Fis domain